MTECTWMGFSGYFFIFLFFLFGTFMGLKDTLSHVVFGFKKGFLFKYSNKKIDGPIGNIIFFGLMTIIGIYATLFHLLPILHKYANCLLSIK